MPSDQHHNHTGRDIHQDRHPASLDAENLVIKEAGPLRLRIEEEERGKNPAGG